MTERQLYEGDTWQPVFKIKSPLTGLPVDPTAVQVTFTDPHGEPTTVSATKIGVGEWTASKAGLTAGTWHATPVASGAYVGVGTIERTVLKAPGI